MNANNWINATIVVKMIIRYKYGFMFNGILFGWKRSCLAIIGFIENLKF